MGEMSMEQTVLWVESPDTPAYPGCHEKEAVKRVFFLHFCLLG